MLVSSAVMVAFAVSFLCTFIAPVVLMIVLGVKKKISVKPLMLGLLSFFVTQFLLRTNILSAVSQMPWYQSSIAVHALLQTFVLALSAGLFEESGRLAGAKIIGKVTYKDAVSFGLGHGLCEMILIAGLGQLSNLILGGMLSGGGAAMLQETLPPADYEGLLAAFAGVAGFDVALGVLERLSAVMFHLFATMLVFRGVAARKTLRYYLLAVAAHTAFNMLAYTLQLGMPLLALEAIWLALGACGLVYVAKSRAAFGQAAPKPGI